jgi:hypothetical protein
VFTIVWKPRSRSVEYAHRPDVLGLLEVRAAGTLRFACPMFELLGGEAGGFQLQATCLLSALRARRMVQSGAALIRINYNANSIDADQCAVGRQRLHMQA